MKPPMIKPWTMAPAPRPPRCRPGLGSLCRGAGVTAGLVLLALIPACITRIGGDTPLDRTADELRQENLNLHREVDKLNQRLEARIQQLQTMEQATTRPAVPGVSPADFPRAVSLAFGRYTGAIDTHHRGRDDTLRLYVLVLDQFGHFIPVAGDVAIQVVYLQPGKAPQVLCQKNLTPAQLNATYRSGFTGTHYTIDVPLPADLAPQIHHVVVKVALTDAATRATLTCEQSMAIQR